MFALDKDSVHFKHSVPFVNVSNIVKRLCFEDTAFVSNTLLHSFEHITAFVFNTLLHLK